MSRKNSKERAVSFDNKDSRSYSISSYGSIETIDLEENEKEKINLKAQRRRKRENNIEEYKRRNTPDIITAKKILDIFKDSYINK